jgi:hypothetical protein
MAKNMRKTLHFVLGEHLEVSAAIQGHGTDGTRAVL